MQIGLTVVAGIVIGLVGGLMFRAAAQNHWTSSTAQQIGNFALALACYYSSRPLSYPWTISKVTSKVVTDAQSFIGERYTPWQTLRKYNRTGIR